MAEVRILYLATAAGLVQLANPGKSDRWREIGRSLEGAALRAVVASPLDALLAYACGAEGIYRSENGGVSWDHVEAEPSTALAFDGAGNVLVGTQRGSVLTTGDGRDWQTVDSGSAPIAQLVVLGDGGVLSLAEDGMVRSRNGSTWRAREPRVPNARGLAAGGPEPQQWFVVDGSSLMTSRGTFSLPAESTGAILLLNGLPPALLLGTRAALLRSADDGATIDALSEPSAVTSLVSPPRFVDQVFAGTSAGELWFSSDRGRAWARLAAGYAAVHGLAFARAL